MSKRGDIEARIEALEKYLETRIEALEEVVDFLSQDLEEDLDDEVDEFIPESKLVHEAYASHAAHSCVGDRQAFISGYLARAREEYGIYAA